MSSVELSRTGLLQERIRESLTMMELLLDDQEVAAGVDSIVEAMVGSIQNGGKVLLCGNGGSAAEAEHLAAELIGRFCMERRPLPAIAIASNVAALTAIANDYDYADAFARAVTALGRPGDVVLGLSTSGGSANIVAALEAARAGEMVPVALVGQPGSPVEDVAEHTLTVPAARTAGIQEGHLLLGHTIFELVERELCAT
ncbi:MAG TPA: SIS domain-containing protein [Solirubrobacteraceae bacterium]|jgi:D-sedoheptulose 7-phosphate isomerase|nr:SIS domain-containing protein [Solirubrobacteraceae bacterium]